MAKIVAKGSKTITTLNDGYTIRLAPPAIIIPTNADGSNPVLTSAKTRIYLSLAGINVPITILSLETSGCTASFTGFEMSITGISAEQGHVIINFKASDDSYSGSVEVSFTTNRQGESGYTVLLSNESHTVPATNDGSVSSIDITNASSSIFAWRGTTPLTAVAANATPGMGEYRYNVQSTTGGTSVRVDNTKFRLNTMTADICVVVVRIYLEGLTNYVEKEMVVVKSKAGQDGLTIMMTLESYVFKGSETAALPDGTTIYVYARRGTANVPATISLVGSAPTGMTVNISGQSIFISVTSLFTMASGNLAFNITVAGQTFTRYFSWAIAFKGAPGNDGDPGPSAPLVIDAGTYNPDVLYHGGSDYIHSVEYNGVGYHAKETAGDFKDVTPTPSGNPKWVMFSAQYESMYTKYLRATSASVDNIVTRRVYVRDPGSFMSSQKIAITPGSYTVSGSTKDSRTALIVEFNASGAYVGHRNRGSGILQNHTITYNPTSGATHFVVISMRHEGTAPAVVKAGQAIPLQEHTGYYVYNTGALAYDTYGAFTIGMVPSATGGHPDPTNNTVIFNMLGRRAYHPSGRISKFEGIVSGYTFPTGGGSKTLNGEVTITFKDQEGSPVFWWIDSESQLGMQYASTPTIIITPVTYYRQVSTSLGSGATNAQLIDLMWQPDFGDGARGLNSSFFCGVYEYAFYTLKLGMRPTSSPSTIYQKSQTGHPTSYHTNSAGTTNVPNGWYYLSGWMAGSVTSANDFEIKFSMYVELVYISGGIVSVTRTLSGVNTIVTRFGSGSLTDIESCAVGTPFIEIQ